MSWTIAQPCKPECPSKNSLGMDEAAVVVSARQSTVHISGCAFPRNGTRLVYTIIFITRPAHSICARWPRIHSPQTLSLRACSRLECLQDITSRCPQLQELNLTNQQEPSTSEQGQLLSTLCPLLSSVKLNRPYCKTDMNELLGPIILLPCLESLSYPPPTISASQIGTTQGDAVQHTRSGTSGS